MDADACTNLLDAGGQTALHIAIGRYGSTAAGTNMAVCLVQAQRTDVNMLSWSGLPPLLMAVRAANLTVVKALLDRDTVDPNILSAPEKAAPLHTAIQQVIAASIVCSNTLDFHPGLALHVAVRQHMHTSRVGLILTLIASTHCRDQLEVMSHTAGHCNRLCSVHPGVLDAWSTPPARPNSVQQRHGIVFTLPQVPRELPLRRGDAPTPSEAIALAICSNSKVDVNLEDGDAHRPVFLAVTCCSSRVLARLLEKGVNLGARDRDGYTPALKATLLAVEGHGPAAAVDGTTAATERASMVIKAGAAATAACAQRQPIGVQVRP